METPWKFFIEPNFSEFEGFNVFIAKVRDGEDRGHFLIDQITITESKMKEGVGLSGVKPSLQCAKDDLQNLINSLWKAGFRPNDHLGGDYQAELKAVRYHLEDMRSLVMSKGVGHV